MKRMRECWRRKVSLALMKCCRVGGVKGERAGLARVKSVQDTKCHFSPPSS